MHNRVDFATNWNNKLAGDYFTTLRLKNDAKWVVGETKEIYLQKKMLFAADIVAVKSFLLNDINDYVAGLDTGYSAVECKNMIKKMYQKYNIDWDKSMLSLILFKKLKSSKSTKPATELQQSA